MIAAGEETTAEFILKPCATKLALKFELVFDNTDGETAVDEIVDSIELRTWKQAFRFIPNPYSTGLPTRESNLFYGREKEMAFLEDNLTRDVKSVVVLYGQRRSGKTTLLTQLIRSPRLAEHIPVFLDMQRLSYNITIESFLGRVAYLIERAMKQRGLSIKAPHRRDFEKDPIYTFDVFLDQIEEQFGDRKLILLIDEFEVLEEQVTSGQLKPQIFEYLRDIVHTGRTSISCFQVRIRSLNIRSGIVRSSSISPSTIAFRGSQHRGQKI